MTNNQRMTAEQTAKLKQLAKAAYELDAHLGRISRAPSSNLRIAMLKAKLKRNGSRRCGFRS